MEYEEYLFVELWNIKDKTYGDLEYDLKYPIILNSYHKFLDSEEFWNDNIGLYESILQFLDNNLKQP